MSRFSNRRVPAITDFCHENVCVRGWTVWTRVTKIYWGETCTSIIFPTLLNQETPKTTSRNRECSASATSSLYLTIFTRMQQVANTHSHATAVFRALEKYWVSSTTWTNFTPYVYCFCYYSTIAQFRALAFSIFFTHTFRSTVNLCHPAAPNSFLASLVIVSIHLSCGFPTGPAKFQNSV